MPKIAVRLCLLLPLLLGCAAPVEPPLVEVDAQCRLSRPQIDRGWLLFFDRNSSVLTKRQKEAAQGLASVFINNHGSLVIVYGHLDGAEQVSSRRNLGLRRAEAVAAVLAEQGIRRRNIFTKDAGFSAPLVPQPVGVSESQNRYVSLRTIGVLEGFATFAARCKAAIHKSCFGPVSGEQRKRCDEALDVLASPG